MMQHDFIPLVTFRGWSAINNCFVFGYHCNISRQDYIITDGMTLDSVVSVESYRDKIQPFALHEKKQDRIAIDHNEMIAVEKDSLGIFTGKHDKTKWEDRPKEYINIPEHGWKGIPIFCGVAGAKYGSDILDFYYGELPVKRTVSFYHGKFAPLYNANDKVVATSQYEQHLKEQSN